MVSVPVIQRNVTGVCRTISDRDVMCVMEAFGMHSVRRWVDAVIVKAIHASGWKLFRRDGKPHHLVVTDAVRKMKELGIEEWLRAQIEQHTCPDCGELIWWERDTCQVCGHRLEAK